IQLEASCIDVPCGVTETCRRGTCVSATLPDPTHCTDPAGCDGKDAGASGSGGSGAGGSGGASSGGTSPSGGSLPDASESGGGVPSSGGAPDASLSDASTDSSDATTDSSDASRDALPAIDLVDDASGCPSVRVAGHTYMVCPGPLDWPSAHTACA